MKRNIEIDHATEGRTLQLITDVSLAGIGGDQEQGLAGLTQTERKIQHPYDPGVNRRRVFDLERGCYATGCPFEPQYVDQPDRLDSLRVFQRFGEAAEAPVSQMPLTAGTVPVVARDPHSESQSYP
jgi:hypothetical protein